MQVQHQKHRAQQEIEEEQIECIQRIQLGVEQIRRAIIRDGNGKI